MGDRYNIRSQLEHLRSKYMGTGHADTSKFDWAVNQHRDTYASYMGHFDLTNYLSLAGFLVFTHYVVPHIRKLYYVGSLFAENESKTRIKFNLLEKMLQPCGPPPEKKTED